MRQISYLTWSFERPRRVDLLTLSQLGTSRTFLVKIMKRKCRYHCHIKRKNNILTTPLEGKVERKRPRRRPRNTWFKDIKVWTYQTAHDCTRSAAGHHLLSVIARQLPKSRWHSQVGAEVFFPFRGTKLQICFFHNRYPKYRMYCLFSFWRPYLITFEFS